jgi:hypothetical protein
MTPDLEAHLPLHLRRRRGKRLTDLQLSEISIVTMPANTGARQLLHKTAEPEVAMTAADHDRIEAAARAGVAAVLTKMTADADAAATVLARMTAASIHKAGEGAAGVAAAVQDARAAEDRPAAFWRAALRQLGADLLPDGTAADQMQRAMASPEGRTLTAAMTGDKRLLSAR